MEPKYNVQDLLIDPNFKAVSPDDVEKFLEQEIKLPQESINLMPPQQLKLISQENVVHPIDRETAYISPKMEELFQEGYGSINMKVKSEIVEIVIQYLKHRKRRETEKTFTDEFEMDEKKSMDILMAACQLGC